MTLSEWVSNVIIGIISGCISGYIVSIYFKKKDDEDRWIKELNDDQQNMSRYITLVCWELDQLMDGTGRETKDLQKLLQTLPRFKSFDELDKIKPEHRTYTKDAYVLFKEIDHYITNEVPKEAYEIPKMKYYLFRSSLLKAQLNILMINKDVVEIDEMESLK